MPLRSLALLAGVSTSLIAIALHLPARADPAPTPDVTGAPASGYESGQIRNDESEPQPSTATTVERDILLVPKGIAYVSLLPVRGVVWVYDRYDLENRYYATFYNASRTFGIHPTIEYATGFGLMVGARLESTDTFGEHERLTMMGAYGGKYQAAAETWIGSGDRLGNVLLTVGGNFDRFARLPFYGIGNADRSPRPGMLIDPLASDTAVKSYYRYQELRAAATADWRVADDVHLVGHGAVTDLQFSPSTRDPSIEMIYDPADLVGFQQGVTHLYGQLELRWDRRRIAKPPWETTQYTIGWLANGFIGGVHGFDQAHDFAHYGVDLQAFIHLGLGPRMLWFRLWGEGVTGDSDTVPFSELPYLGGDFLRGYDFGRFRDRVAGLGSVQYIWDIQRSVDAFLFVDAGRVYHSLDNVTLDALRVGYGGGLQFHNATDFLLAASLASSIDGGLFLTATLTPYWNEVPRWR